MAQSAFTPTESPQIITIKQRNILKEKVDTVNARDLHGFLESKREFATWIKSRIKRYGFIEKEDFLTILSKTPKGGRPTKNYHLSIDMAKELSMVERTEKGRQARRYFIECEKIAKETVKQEFKPKKLPEPEKALPEPDSLKEIIKTINDFGFRLDKIILSSKKITETAWQSGDELRAIKKAVLRQWPEEVKRFNCL